jgi:hypothetical protein
MVAAAFRFLRKVKGRPHHAKAMTQTFPTISGGNWFAFLTMPTKIFELLPTSAVQGDNS